MMDKDRKLIQDVLETLFGEVTIEVDEEADGYYVEVKGAPVMIVRDTVETETLNGPVSVPGWAVGSLMPDGEYDMDVTATTLWEALSYAAESITDAVINNLRWAKYAEEVAPTEVF
jgi:CBS domain containing-hemolysin-like protein